MRRRNVFTGLTLGILFLLTIAQGQQSSTTLVQLGNRTIDIPSPVGFEEASSRFESVKKRFTATEAPELDLLAVHMTTDDIQRLNRAEKPALDSYTKVSVQRSSRGRVSTSAELEAIKKELRRPDTAVFDINNPSLQPTLKNLNKGLTELNARETTVDMNQPIVLGEFQNTPNIYATLIVIKYKVNTTGRETVDTVVFSVSYVRAKDRLIYVYAYRKYLSQQDATAVVEFAKRWNNQIVAANAKP